MWSTCEIIYIIGSGNVREMKSTKMPHSSENFLCGLCKDSTTSAMKLVKAILVSFIYFMYSCFLLVD